MEKELEKRFFLLNEYINKGEMEKNIKIFIKELKIRYPNAVITKEFYRGSNILVRATEIKNAIN